MMHLLRSLLVANTDLLSDALCEDIRCITNVPNACHAGALKRFGNGRLDVFDGGVPDPATPGGAKLWDPGLLNIGDDGVTDVGEMREELDARVCPHAP